MVHSWWPVQNGRKFPHMGLMPVQSLSPVRLFTTPRTAASDLPVHHQLPAAAAKSLQLCLTLCDPIVGSPPGSPIPGILQARTLEWAAISFSNAWKWKVKVKLLSRVRLLATSWTAAYRAPGVHPNPCPLSRWCHPTISSSVVPFFSCPQSFPASGPFQMSQLFASGGQVLEFQIQASVLPMNIHMQSNSLLWLFH